MAWLSTLCALGMSFEVEALDEQAFYDYARVTHVVPIQDMVQVPVESTQCETYTPPQDSDKLAALAGDVRSTHPNASLADVLRADLSRWQRMHSSKRRQCRLVKSFANELKTVAYRVHYRYGEDTFVKRMDHDPGEWLRIRVHLQATY